MLKVRLQKEIEKHEEKYTLLTWTVMQCVTVAKPLDTSMV